jgi:hypothetical protein
MAGSLFYNPKPQFFTSTGAVASGYKLFFYTAGTTTKKDTYTTSALSVANSNPITLNSRGEITGDVYLNGAYKVVLALSTSADPPGGSDAVWTVDNVTSLSQVTSTSTRTSNYTVLVSDYSKTLLIDATSGNITISLPSLATAGDGFNFNIKKIDSSSNTVTIDPNGAELVDGASTYTLTKKNESLALVAESSSWRLFSIVRTLKDDNNNLVLSTSTTANAVNYVNATNAATAGTPVLAAAGTDTNIALNLAGKGTGSVQLGQATSTGVVLVADQPILDSSNNELIKFTKTTSAVNEITIANKATGANPSISATGGDTNIGLDLQSKGTGTYNLLGTSSQEARLRLYEDTDNGTNYCEIRAPASITANRTVTLPDADVDLTVATQADIETATDVTKIVTPGRVVFHPGIAKAWVYFLNAGTPTISSSYNVSSLTDGGVGLTTVNFIVPFSGSYSVAGMAIRGGTGAASINVCQFVTISTSAFTVATFLASSGAGANGEIDCQASVVCYGDQ